MDHIGEVYHKLNSKYQSGLHWILAGDTNNLKLGPILSLSPKLRQVVQNPTRKSEVLDPIITSLSSHYQPPVCLPPLDNDPDKKGAPSDHMIVFMQPINAINNNPARIKRKVKVRPLLESGIRDMGRWIVSHTWEEVYSAVTTHEKADVFQTILLQKLNYFLPEKVITFSSDNQVWVTPEIKQLSRKKSREYFKNRKSPKWKELKNLLSEKCETARKAYYLNIVKDLKQSNPAQWYSKLKRMTSYDDQKSEEVLVENISHLTNYEQAEKIADHFSAISNSYEPIDSQKVLINSENNNVIPKFEAFQVYEVLKKIKTNVPQQKTTFLPSLLKSLLLSWLSQWPIF